MRARGIVAVVVLAAVALFLFLQDRSGFAARGGSLPELRSLTSDAFVPHLRFLSDDRLEGRAPSTPGGELAAQYLAAQLSLLGYTPAGDNGTYFQQVPVFESVIDPASSLRIGQGAPLKFSSEIVASSARGDAVVPVSGEIVFVGHGIVAPEYGWDDYAGTDVTGKIVLVMVNEPKATPAEPTRFGGDSLTYYGRWTYKFEEAARRGAAGVLLIHTDESATYPWQVVESTWGGSQYSLPPVPGAPVLALKAWVTDDTAHRIVRTAGYSLDNLRRAAASNESRAVPLGVHLSGTLVRRVRQKTTPNVIGVLKGDDPAEAVIVTAHYDHLGVRAAAAGEPAGTDRTFNGALDNASGVAGTLALARVFAQASDRLRRSIYVLFTTAEESNLLGSEHFVTRAPLPLRAWAAVVNIDELNVFGPSRDLVLVGEERSTIGDVARRIAARAGRVVTPEADPGEGNFFRSDHFSLAKAGIPAVSISLPSQFIGPDQAASRARRDRFSEHDYHQTSDHVRDDWNYEGAIADLRLLGDLVWTLANQADVPVYHPNEPLSRVRR